MNAWPLLRVDMESGIRSPLLSTIQVVFGKSMWTFIFRIDSLRDDHLTWG